MRAAFYTLGCKLNQYETESLAESFKLSEFEIVEYTEKADIYIINTCTVTTKSEQKARRIIRKLSSENIDSLIVITGCYAQLEREKLKSLAPNILIISQDNKSIIHDFPKIIMNNNYRFREVLEELEYSENDKFSYTPFDYSFHSRAFVKIQDGCDYMCTYCRVPLARGKSVSMDYNLLINYIKQLENKGYREVVLTGVNIASYKYENIDFNILLKKILDETENSRIRISSLEPEKINSNLIDTIKNNRICPHFHIPVQSGSDKILRFMKRRYKSTALYKKVALLRKAKDEPFISADIIIGFPGETDEDFKETQELIEKCSFASLHIFRYSRRPGTKAYSMKPQVPERIVKERMNILNEIKEKQFLNYIRKCSPDADAVLEKRENKKWIGLSGNYLKLLINNVPETSESGRLIACKILNKDKITSTDQVIDAEFLKLM